MLPFKAPNKLFILYFPLYFFITKQKYWNKSAMERADSRERQSFTDVETLFCMLSGFNKEKKDRWTWRQMA